MSFLRSLLFALLMWITTPIFALTGLMLFPFPFSVRYGLLTRWARLHLWWLKLTCGISYQVFGAENIPKQNAIIMCKHQSTWETLALQKIFPPQIWLLKRELLWLPFFGWGLALLEPIAIDRSAGRKALKELVEQGKQRLKKGRWVVVFPEGTRVKVGEKGNYSVGGARLAQKSGYPVIPVAHNAGRYWSKGGFIKKPGVIQMHIGPVIESTDKSAKEISQAVEDWIENKMMEL